MIKGRHILEVRKVLIHLPILLLVLIVLSQLKLFYSKNKAIELDSLKKATSALVTDHAKEYRTIKNPVDAPLYVFAQEIDRDIPIGSKILYLNSTRIGTNTVIYYQINTYKPRNHDADYTFNPEPTTEEVIRLIKTAKADYLVDFNNQDIVKKNGQPTKGKPAIYRVENNELVLFRDYNL